MRIMRYILYVRAAWLLLPLLLNGAQNVTMTPLNVVVCAVAVAVVVARAASVCIAFSVGAAPL